MKTRKADKEMQFDAFLSGTSATLIVQINRAPKRVYVAWVGDSKFIIGSEIQNLGATLSQEEALKQKEVL